MNTLNRTAFIKEFIALVRFIAAGEANIGFLGKERTEIHRGESKLPKDMEDEEGEVQPPQEAMDHAEEERWRQLNAACFAN